MGQKYQERDKEEKDETFDAGFTIPDTKGVLASLTQELKNKHEEETEELEKQGRSPKKRQVKAGTVCCCGDINCRIGPMVEMKGK